MIPETIKIGDQEVRVYIASMVDMYGFFDPENNTINLNVDNTPAEMTATFWHELIHAINYYNRLQVELSMELGAMQQDEADPEVRAAVLEERISEDFSRVFVQVIKENNLLDI